MNMKCPNGCCAIQKGIYRYVPYVHNPKHKYKRSKAGVFFYDPESERVLLVQSHGKKWGSPKGTMEEDKKETIQECALREVEEETGICLSMDCLKNYYRIDRSTYYYVEREWDPSIQIPSGEESIDVTGICWIKLPCLLQLCFQGKMELNAQSKKLLRKFLDVQI
jgi:8-oxo-dGTP pyrophosphatase MutT (NUDIX family)